MTTRKPQDLKLDTDCGDSGAYAIYDHNGKKVALVFDQEKGQLLVDCYNLTSFLITNERRTYDHETTTAN